ncbi:MAG: hypothetical protein D6805_03230 [Planctomycetota bacterium]|nr:MAG: hypothetical protein D6805_03230 [Planctomycetota bacterium]
MAIRAVDRCEEREIGLCLWSLEERRNFAKILLQFLLKFAKIEEKRWTGMFRLEVIFYGAAVEREKGSRVWQNQM